MSIRKKIFLTLGVIIGGLLIAEGIALYHEKASVQTFADYWRAQNLTSTGGFTYVALGDSTAQGIGASKATNSYVGLLSERVATQTGKKVRLINLSVTGAKIEDVLSKQLPQLANYKPDLVTIEIGANDLSGYDDVQFNKKFTELASLLPDNTYVSDMPFFGGRNKDNSPAVRASKHIAAAVSSNKLNLVKLQDYTQAHQSFTVYAADFFHPINKGYINWADAFWMQIKPDLTK
ncbi:MAG: SGNH/GDSL hydrolase family protein [Candidatus Saccharimonadales bacterium]